ncbi:asparagine synthase (glutamine-hydrolyzing) [Caenimonas terrae]|uniref:asparagine synthase (glutamine-hydrolyzing) n=1 Tax=Caenimonas terrae TaxID=696074 RepID=A0ABW0NFM8_9BURK
MCGINGVICLGGAPSEAYLKAEIAEMNDAVAHRGPDGEGAYVNGNVALGHRRLSIIDLSAGGHQPMFNEDDSLVLVFNGEIYNYLELIPVLKALGHVFRSHSDSEVILHAYEAWGPQCVERFNGMWAFAIWDVKRKRLFASRDRLGVKPFYYVKDAVRLIFSSEIKGIAAVRPLHHANLAKVHDYLRYGYRTSDGSTFFADVHELMPGQNLVLEDGDVTVTRYWQLPSEQGPIEPDTVLRSRFSDLLEDAVRLRFRSDVPVALLQSGGLDSSAICRVVDDDIESGRLACESVTAFTAVFPGFEHDEQARVRELIGTCKHVKLVELSPTAADLLADLPKFVAGMGEPVQSTTSFVHWQIMQAVHARGIKVIINGQGADEALAGYAPYIVGYRLLDTLLANPLKMWSQARAMRARLGYPATKLIAQTAKAMLGRRAASKWRAARVEGTTQVLNSEFCQRHDAHLPDTKMSMRPRNLDRHLRGQIEHYGFNQILHYEDHSAMMSSIEMRSPFVDYRLMEFAFRLPDRMKFDLGVTKRIQREAFASRLPRSIVNNHSKIGFATPFQIWMTNPALNAYLREIVDSSSFQARSIWKGDEIMKRFAESGRYPNFPFWRFINLELWARAYGISNL